MLPTDDRKVVKIEPSVYDELIDLQHNRRKADGRKTSISDLISELLEEARPATTQSQPAANNTSEMPSPYLQENREQHEQLETILVSGTEEDRIGIKSNLQWAVTTIKGRRKKRHLAAG